MTVGEATRVESISPIIVRTFNLKEEKSGNKLKTFQGVEKEFDYRNLKEIGRNEKKLDD